MLKQIQNQSSVCKNTKKILLAIFKSLNSHQISSCQSKGTGKLNENMNKYVN